MSGYSNARFYTDGLYDKLVRKFYYTTFLPFFNHMIKFMKENHEEKCDSFITMNKSDCDFLIDEILSLANDISSAKMNDRVQNIDDFVHIANYAGMFYLRNSGIKLITEKDFVENFLKACKIGLDDGENR